MCVCVCALQLTIQVQLQEHIISSIYMYKRHSVEIKKELENSCGFNHVDEMKWVELEIEQKA